MLRIMHPPFLPLLAMANLAWGLPNIEQLAGHWIDITAPVSERASLGAEQRDLPTINNFWGAVGIAPQGVRPVDMFAINSLELPPFAGCGRGTLAPYGCGRMLVNGGQLPAVETRWAAHEAGRRSAPIAGSGVVVESFMRMPFEQPGIIWDFVFNNPTTELANVSVDFELSAMVSQYATVGTWVYGVPNDPTAFVCNESSSEASGQKGVTCCDAAHSAHPACAEYRFVGTQPDELTVPPSAPTSCNISGEWIQEASGQQFGPIASFQDGTFSWSGNPHYAQDGWDKFNGSVARSGSISLTYYRDYPHIKNPGKVTISGRFVGDCSHIQMQDSAWRRPNSPPSPPEPSFRVPSATFRAVRIPAGGSTSIQVAMAVGSLPEDTRSAANAFAGDPATFADAWAAAYSKWQARWEVTFTL